MSTTSQLSGIIRGVLTQPTGGIAGLVDGLLVICRKHGLQLEWQAGRCRFRPAGGDWEELADVPLRKSVFRAILGRLAALCNEQTPNAVSPYGGQCELSADANSPTLFRVTFTNTAEEQKLELTTEAVPATEASRPAGQFEKPVAEADGLRARNLLP
jgi:hypothetical protein